jgi:hypothetical protein
VGPKVGLDVAGKRKSLSLPVIEPWSSTLVTILTEWEISKRFPLSKRERERNM